MKSLKKINRIIICLLILSFHISQHKSLAQGTWSKHDTTLANGYLFPMDSVVFVLQTNQMWRYSPASKIWNRKADYPGASIGSGYNMTINGKAYIGTGAPNTEFWCYDPATDTWLAKANFPGPARNAAFATSLNGLGYVAKGYAPITSSGSCSIFVGGVWSQTTTTNYADFYKYNPINNTWNLVKNSIGTPSGELTGFTANNKIYFGLGLVNNYKSGSGRCVTTTTRYDRSSVSEFYEYDPLIDSFTKKASLIVPGSNGDDYAYNNGRASAAGFSINNLGFVAGGYYVRYQNLNCSGSSCFLINVNHTDNLMVYDPLKNKWIKGDVNWLSSGTDKYFTLENKAYQIENTSIYQLSNADKFIIIDSIKNFRYCPNDSTFRIYYSKIGNFDSSTKFKVEMSKMNFSNNYYTLQTYDSTGIFNQELKNLGAQGYINAFIYSGRNYNIPAANCCLPSDMYYFRITGFNNSSAEISQGTHSPTPYSLYQAPGAFFNANGSIPLCSNNNSISFNNASIPSGTDYQWTFGDGTTSSISSPTKSYTQPGSFLVTLTANLYGCKSTWTELVKINATDSSTVNRIVCDSFSIGGNTYTNSGTYFNSLTNRYGCDSVVKLNLTILNKSYRNIFDTICAYEAPYLWNGSSYNQSGVYSFISTNASGCDSIVVLSLTVNRRSRIDSVSICNNNIPYAWYGTNYASSGVYTIVISNSEGCDSTIYLNLNVENCYVEFNVKAFLQGYYIGNSQMRPAIFNSGMSNIATATDSIEVSLWESSNVSNPNFKARSIINNSGIMTAYFPLSTIGQSYYLSLKHRNSIQTWSKNPILINAENFYDFSTNSNKAYSDGFNEPLINLGNGIYAIYSGDVNQDGSVDIFDMQNVENNASQFAFGYYNSDCSGDGNTDVSDMNIIENNVGLFIYYARP